MIGLKRGAVSLEPFNSKWKTLFEIEKNKIQELIGEFIEDIQHVGSTAIPEISAKPIIDIAIALDTFENINVIIDILENEGYKYRPQSSHRGEYLFVKGNDNFRTHHIHIVMWKSESWNNYIFFRNYLVKNQQARKRYDQLKHILAKQYKTDRKKYTKSKGKFIQQILTIQNKY